MGRSVLECTAARSRNKGPISVTNPLKATMLKAAAWNNLVWDVCTPAYEMVSQQVLLNVRGQVARYTDMDQLEQVQQRVRTCLRGIR